MLTFNCSRCGRLLRLREEFAGGKARCPDCGAVGDVPGVHEEANAGAAGHQARSPAPGEVADLPTSWPAGDEPAAAAAGAVPEGLLAPPQGPDELGRLGPYRVLRVLGVGGMGVVFHAEDAQLRRPVALKALLPALAAGADARARFLREARAAAAVGHDHVVTIYQVGEDRGIPFLAMQFLEGESLEDRLRCGRRLPVPEVLRVGREIAEGLAAAHARGVIHRDIKPANIWLERRGDGRPACRPATEPTGGPPVATDWRVKILDFGLARAASDDTRLTRSGALVGTPGYLAPEQVQGGAVGPHSDLFSLGCVLYRCCTGQPPFGTGDALATLAALATGTPRPVRDLNPAVPPALADLVTRLLARDPARRPPSARAVVDALAALEKQGPGRTVEPVGQPQPGGDALAVPGQAPRLAAAPPALPMGPVPNVRRPTSGALLAGLVGGLVALLGLFAVCLAGAGWLALRGPLSSLAGGKASGPEHWTVLFRSDDPAVWDTDSPGENFAVPLRRAPADIHYVRLRGTDTGEALILPLTRGQLNKGNMPTPQEGCWWNGTAKDDYGARHLGIAQAGRLKWPNLDGVVSVMDDGWDAFRGSGFGHLCMRNQTGQHYCWRGKEIPRTVFEIAVTAERLTEEEKRFLVPDQ
jgi:serine/threonine protein kinase